MEKKLRSECIVRFSDCDLFGHLNNAQYINYFLDAREDQLKQYYDMDLQTFYHQGLSWYVGGHEILYLRPAQYRENVVIYSSTILGVQDALWVEFLMTDARESHLKAIMWTKFVPVNVKTGRKESHPESFMDFVKQVVVEGVDLQAGMKERVGVLMAALKGKTVQVQDAR